MQSIRYLVRLPLFTTAVITALSLAPREARATSECRGGCLYADNIQLTATNKPACVHLTAIADPCDCLSVINVENLCDEPFEAQDFKFAYYCQGCSSIANRQEANISLAVDQSSNEATGTAKFTALSGDETVTIEATFDINGVVGADTSSSSSGCSAAGAPGSAPSWLLAGAGALALAAARRRSRRA
jgi:MYXO-CTERM domain-containing protein